MSDPSAGWPQKRALYLLIGQGISMWSGAEAIIAEIFASLMGSPPEKAGLVIYSINNFYTWLTIIDDLISIDDRFAPIKDEWGRIAEKLKGLNDTRVRLAHHTAFTFGEMPSGPPSLRPSYMDTRSKSRKHAPLTSGEIDTFCDEVDSMLDRLIALKSAIESLPKKSGE
jgi:hypothetical protein